MAKRLLDQLKVHGFQFRRIAPGEDGPLVGNRVAGNCVDIVHIEGFSRDCFAWRKRTSSLIVTGNGLVERQVDGTALDVVNALLSLPAPGAPNVTTYTSAAALDIPEQAAMNAPAQPVPPAPADQEIVPDEL